MRVLRLGSASDHLREKVGMPTAGEERVQEGQEFRARREPTGQEPTERQMDLGADENA